jgi:hypothetical protein
MTMMGRTGLPPDLGCLVTDKERYNKSDFFESAINYFFKAIEVFSSVIC